MGIKDFAKEEEYMNEVINFIYNESTKEMLKSLPEEDMNRVIENIKALYKIAKMDEEGKGNIKAVLIVVATLMVDISLNYDINYSIEYTE